MNVRTCDLCGVDLTELFYATYPGKGRWAGQRSLDACSADHLMQLLAVL